MRENNFEFKHIRSGAVTPNVVTTTKIDTELLPEILEEFDAFLRGCGFHFDGSIGIVEDDE